MKVAGRLLKPENRATITPRKPTRGYAQSPQHHFQQPTHPRKLNAIQQQMNGYRRRDTIHDGILCCVSLSVVSDSLQPMDCSPPGSPVHGILQERVLEWAAIPFSRGSSHTRGWTQVSCMPGRFFTVWTTREEMEYNSPWKKTRFCNLQQHS